MQHALRNHSARSEGLDRVWALELLDRIRHIIQQKADRTLDCVLNDITVHAVAKPAIPW